MSGAPTVLFTTQTHTVWGGMEWFVDLLAKELAGRGWNVIAGLAQGARFNRAERYRQAHPHLRTVTMDAVQTESARIAAVERAILSTRPDVVIPIALGATFPAMRRVKATSPTPPRFVVPVFSMFPGWLIDIEDHRDIADRVISNSRLTCRYLEPSIPAERLRHIPQGTLRRTTTRSESSGPLRVGFVGRLEEVSKRVLDLIALVRLLTQQGVRDRFEIEVFGDGPERGQLEETLKDVRFHGYRPTPDLYASAYPNLDVLLLFSPSEGSPNAVYEAMQNEVVPVTSRYLALAAEGIVRHGENALTFPVGDVETTARHLITLDNDRALLRRLGIAARQACERWSVADMNDAWCDMLEKALDAEPLRSGGIPTVPHAGRLDRFIGPRTADRLRRFLPPRPAIDGWDEWPGTSSAGAARTDAVVRTLRELDR